MLYINTGTAARTLNVMQVEKISFLTDYITLLVL